MSATERSACELGAHRLREAMLQRDEFVDFGESLKSLVDDCLPRELRETSCCHSKVLGVASKLDGSYAAFYRVDASKLERKEFGYGRDLRFSVGGPNAWRVDDCGGYEWSGEWDVRERPWLKKCGAQGGWSRPYADPVTGDLLESFVLPLTRDGGDVVGVVVAGTFRVAGRGPAKKRGPAPEFLELRDPKLRSRLLYPNPVCLLTTSSLVDGAWKKNAMTISWLSPMNNAGDLILSLNKKRFSADAVLEGRSFGLSVPTSDMAPLVLSVGAKTGRTKDKFQDIPGLVAITPVDEATRPKNGFAALADSSSDDGDDDDAATPSAPASASSPPPVFFVGGCVARLQCKLTKRLDGGDDDHYVLQCHVEDAAVREDYWANGKTFLAPDLEGAPPYLTFLGSQTFGHVARAE